MKNYSNNCGHPVEKMVVPTLAESINLFNKLRHSGQIFRVDFIKRGDGSYRTMLCRFGTKKHLKGGKLRYDADNKGLCIVYDWNRLDFRSFAIDNTLLIKHGGVIYNLNQDTDIKKGTYKVTLPSGKRTFAAHTSPMYHSMESVA